jgi:hypothetical protein
VPLEQDDVKLILKEFDLPLSAGWAMCRTSAARLKFCWVASATKYLSCLRSTTGSCIPMMAGANQYLPVIGGRGFLYLMHSGRGLKWECTGRE